MSEMFSCFQKFGSSTIDALSNNLLVSVFTQFGTELVTSFYGYKRIYNFFEGSVLDEQHDVTKMSSLLSENSNKTSAFYIPWKCGVRTDKLPKFIPSMS